MTTVYRLNKQSSNSNTEIDLSALEKLEVEQSAFIPLSNIQFYKRPQKSLKARVKRLADHLHRVFLIYPYRQRGFFIKRTL